jgi:hypothetical protein
MTAYPLVLVRKSIVYPVPPVCSAYWTAEDWAKQARTVVEPLAIDTIGYHWTATGERNTAGKLLYTAVR